MKRFALLAVLVGTVIISSGATPPPKGLRIYARTLTPTAETLPKEYVTKTEVIVETPAPVAPATVKTPQTPQVSGLGGYALPYGNCVDEPGVKRQPGNPISWQPTTQTPYPGATFLFYTNHTGVVASVNGDMITVRHRNYQGGQYVFPRSMFRGFI